MYDQRFQITRFNSGTALLIGLKTKIGKTDNLLFNTTTMDPLTQQPDC